MAKLVARILRYLLSLVEKKDPVVVNYKYGVGQKFSLPYASRGGKAEILSQSVNRRGTKMYAVNYAGRRTRLSETTIDNYIKRRAWVSI